MENKTNGSNSIKQIKLIQNQLKPNLLIKKIIVSAL